MAVESNFYLEVPLIKGNTESVISGASTWDNIGTLAVSSLRKNEESHQRGVLVSRYHGRSIEYLSSVAAEPIEGPDGRLRTSISIKGGVLYDPRLRVRKGRVGAGLRITGIEGMYELDTAKRAKEITDILHSHNFPIDWILDVRKLNSVRVGKQNLSLERFKSWLVSKEVEKTERMGGMFQYSLDELRQMEAYLASKDYGVIWRATEVSERFAEFAEGTKEDFYKVLHRAIDYINMQERAAAQEEGRSPKYFLYEGDYAYNFIMQYFPQALATSYGRLHGELGVVQSYSNAHTQNWLTTGTLADPDGMKGEILGDSPITRSDIIADIRRIVKIKDISFGFHVPDLGLVLEELFLKKIIRPQEGKTVGFEIHNFAELFLRTYLPFVKKHRGIEGALRTTIWG